MQTYTRPYLMYLFAVCLIAVTITACDSTEPDDDGAGEEELITRVVLTLQGGGATVTATADDPDGDGVDIQTETLVLQPGITYSGTLGLFNDTATDPAERDIGAEVREEADEHQVFYTLNGFGQSVTLNISDQDSNGLPVGLNFVMMVDETASGSGTLNVVLSHYDEEPKNGTDRSGETDVDVTFPVTVGQ